MWRLEECDNGVYRMRSVGDESGVLLKSDNLMNRRKNGII